MQRRPITLLDDASPTLSGTELLPITQSGALKKVSLNALATAVASRIPPGPQGPPGPPGPRLEEGALSGMQPLLDVKSTHADLFSDFVVSGLLSPASANLTSTLSAGIAYVAGRRVVKAAETFTYAANSDTYEDMASTGVITRSVVPNGGAVPAVTANTLRLQKVVTNATAVTAVTQLAALVPTTTLRDRANHNGTQLAATVSDFTAAARTAAVADTITDAVTNVAPSQNAVFDALALKYDKTGGAISGPVSVTGAISATGAITQAGSQVWHAGNFDPAAKLNKAGDTMTGQLTISGGIRDNSQPAARFENQGGGVVTGASGVGFEIVGTSGGQSFLQTYDRTAGAYAPLNCAGSVVNLQSGATTIATASSTGLAVTGALSATGAINANGGQIKFPATQNASTDATTLDDYREMDFTPTIRFGGLFTGVTYAAQQGRCTRIGRVVHYSLAIALSAKGSATGEASIHGMPFAHLGAPPAVATIVVQAGASVTGPIAIHAVNDQHIFLHQMSGATLVALNETNFTDTTIVRITGTYQAF